MIELTEQDLERQTVKRSIMSMDHDTELRFDELIELHGPGLSIEWIVDYDYNSEYHSVKIWQTGIENDAEYDRRIDDLKLERMRQAMESEDRALREKKAKAKKEREERKLYEKLKAKFEKG